MRNLEALGDFLRQMPSQRDNRVLAVAVQQKDKVLVDFKMTEDQNRDNIIMASKKSATAQHHTQLARKEAAEAYENEERLRVVYEVAHREYEEAFSVTESMREALNEAVGEENFCQEAYDHARAKRR